MKKLITVLFATILLVGCSGKPSSEKTIRVSCTPDPHCQILEQAKPLLEKKGFDLKIVELTDYYIFNRSLNNKEVDANYFQHLPFFNKEVDANKYDLVNLGGIHIEPFGFYSQKIKDISELKEGDNIIISNSVADQGRILSILAKKGLIKVKDNFDPINGSIKDIVESKYNFKEIDPQLLVSAYENKEGALVGINGNYAISGGLKPNSAIILETADKSNPYVNIVATNKELENSEKVKALIEVLKSNDIKEYIKKTWGNGAVIPAE